MEKEFFDKFILVVTDKGVQHINGYFKNIRIATNQKLFAVSDLSEIPIEYLEEKPSDISKIELNRIYKSNTKIFCRKNSFEDISTSPKSLSN